MNTQFLLSLFVINLLNYPLIAVSEINVLPLETTTLLDSYVQPPLPQLKIHYDVSNTNQSEYLQPTNFGIDGSNYCPHTEILTKILNELRNILPQDSNKIKNILSNYYSNIENALNIKYSVESVDKLSSENHLNYIDSLVEKLKLMDDKNVKIKITLEYEIPTIHKTICEKLCNNLIHFANAGNSAAINDLKYPDERDKIQNNIMTFLQNYRPDDRNSDSPYNTKLKNQLPIVSEPNLNAPSNPVPIVSIPNNLEPMSYQTNSDSLKKLAALLQENSENADTSPSKYLPTPLPNPIDNMNSLQNLAFPPPSFIETADPAKYSNQYPLLGSTATASSYPIKNFISVPQRTKGPSNYYPVSILAPPVPSFKGAGNVQPLNQALISQKPTRPDNSYKIPNFPPQLQKITENAKDIDEFAKTLGEKYQYVSENNPSIITPTKYENPKLGTFPNSWSPSNFVSKANNYNNNDRSLQEQLIQLYNQNKPPMSNLVLETTTLAPGNLYHNNKNLPNIKQYESGMWKMDSTLTQANSLNKYNQHLESVKNSIYPQTNPENFHLLNQQVPYSSLKFDPFAPFAYANNNALHNSYGKNFNQPAPQSYIPYSLAPYPNSYYYNPNMGITKDAKSKQENYGDQLHDLQRLLGVSNLDKLNYVSSKNGIVELTYKVNHSKPLVEPFYYVKYRLPYDVFMFNLKKLLIEKPSLRNQSHILYKNLLIGSNITGSSSDLKNLNKDELSRLVFNNGTLVTAKVLDTNDVNEQIKIVQKLNANMPLKDIVSSDANITRVLNFTSNIPIMSYLKNLNDLQKKATNRYYSNPRSNLANQIYNQNVRYPTYVANRIPPREYSQNTINYPYSPHGLNSIPTYG